MLSLNINYFLAINSYIDNNGFLNKELSDGNVHISDGTFIKKFINNFLV